MKAEQKTAWLFPGQGIQEVGMGLDHYRKHPLARYIYSEVDRITGMSIRRISFEGSKEEQNQTANTQLIIFALTKVCLELLKNRGNGKRFSDPAYLAGNSLGEYNAAEAGNACSFEDTVRLVQARSKYMQMASEINQGSLAASSNPSEETIEKFRALGLEIALINTSDQTVFGGLNASLDEAENWAKENRIRFTRLPVAGAFHTSLMEPAVEPFSKALEGIEIRDSRVPIIANTTAKPIQKAEDIREEFIRQLTHPVLWKDTIDYLDQQGVHRFIEVGGKRILINMVNRIIAGGAIGTITIAGGITAAVLWRRHHRA